jgi:predicted nucleic acid-binding protein
VNETKYLLDTSAILAFMEDEDGAERVEEILKQEQAIIPFPVFLEAYYISLQERSEAIADRRYAMMRQLPVTEIWTTNEPTLLTAARIKANFRVSFADALIAAFAVQNEAILVHKDPELDALQGKVQQETLPYK